MTESLGRLVDRILTADAGYEVNLKRFADRIEELENCINALLRIIEYFYPGADARPIVEARRLISLRISDPNRSANITGCTTKSFTKLGQNDKARIRKAWRTENRRKVW